MNAIAFVAAERQDGSAVEHRTRIDGRLAIAVQADALR